MTLRSPLEYECRPPVLTIYHIFLIPVSSLLTSSIYPRVHTLRISTLINPARCSQRLSVTFKRGVTALHLL